MSMARTQLSHSTIDRMNKPKSVGPAVSFNLWEKIQLGCKLLQFFPCTNTLPNVSIPGDMSELLQYQDNANKMHSILLGVF